MSSPTPPEGWTIRDATPEDAAACARVYAPYVEEGVTSFEEHAPTTDEMGERIAAAQEAHAWLVIEDADGVFGYAYGTTFRTRAAYRRTCETSVYLAPGVRRSGAGRALYAALLDRLRERGMHLAVAGMTLPNDASAGLHAALGFEPVGVFREIGFKRDAWHDVAWVQKIL